MTKKNKDDYDDQPKPDQDPGEKPRYFSNTRMLTPSELEALKKDMRKSLKVMKGRFKDLA